MAPILKVCSTPYGISYRITTIISTAYPEDYGVLNALRGSSFCKYELTCCYYWQIDGFVCAVSDYSRFLTSRSSNALPCNSVGGTTSS